MLILAIITHCDTIYAYSTHDLGECGEVCEIFQWKGTLEAQPGSGLELFNEKEMINIGEEIADVFIYSTRLCEVCDIDMAHAARSRLAACGSGVLGVLPTKFEKGDPPKGFQARRPQEGEWEKLGMGQLGELAAQMQMRMETQTQTQAKGAFRSARHVSLCLQAAVGRVCALFATYPESESAPGLASWSSGDVGQLAWQLGHICVLLSCLAQFSGHDLGDCVGNKFGKNEKKYPVDLARGSSAKYTAYAESVAQRQQLASLKMKMKEAASTGSDETGKPKIGKTETGKPGKPDAPTGMSMHGYIVGLLVVAVAGAAGFALGQKAPR
jgi:dCTP diphosphatase